jgi:integrase
LEIIWTSELLLKNSVIKEYLSCLNDKESTSLIKAIKALYLTPELTNICQVLLRLEDTLNAIKSIEWPDEINIEIINLNSAISKIKTLEFFIAQLNKEKNTSKNPIYGRIEEYPVAALFCQQFGLSINDNQKPLLFLLNFMLFQISKYNQWELHKKDTLLTNAANTLRKIIACDSEFKVRISLEKLNYDKLSKLLITLTDGKYIVFQDQFLIAWSDFYEDQPFVRIIPYQQSEQHNEDTSDFITGTLNLFSKQIIETGNGTYINSGFISTLGINDELDIDESVIEFVDVISPDNVELDHRTKDSAAIYGSRLSLIEKKHLPWRSISLATHEVVELVAYLESRLEDLIDPTVIFATLVFLTSKPFIEVLGINIYSKPPQLTYINSDFIDLTSGSWWRRSIEMPSAYKPSPEQTNLLAIHSDWLMLPLPKQLVLALKKLITTTPMTIKQLCFKEKGNTLDAALANFLRPLWMDNDKVHRRITPAAVRATLFDKITEQYDSGYAALMLANSEFDTPTTLYYISARSNKLRGDYIALVSGLGFQLSENIDDEDNVIGSKLSIDKAEIARVIKSKRAALLQMFSETSPSLEQLIVRHNQFVNYTLLILIASTGHRSRTEFGFTSYSMDDRAGYSLISDKINFVDSSIRVIPQCTILKKQLISYKNHCADLSRLIKPYNFSLAKKLSKVFKLQVNDEPTFFHIVSNNVIPVGSSKIEGYLLPEINLPLNFLRHYFCSALRLAGEFKFAKALMGHVGSGEHILSDHSCDALENIKSVGSAIDHLLTEIGIEAIEITPSRGPKINVGTDEIGELYSPSYLRRSEITERSCQIRWVRKLISPRVKELMDPKTHEETVDELLKQAAADQNSVISIERRLYWLNRVISKVSKAQRWVAALNEPERLAVEPVLILRMRQAQFIKEKVNEWILSNNEFLTHQEQIAKIWCSLTINSDMDVPINLPNLSVMKEPPFYEHGMAWFEMLDSKSNQTHIIHIDSISLLLIQRYSISTINIKSAADIKKCILQNILYPLSKQNNLDHVARSALKTIDSTGMYLREARDPFSISLLHAYQNKRLLTTNIPPEKLCRWLSATPTIYETSLIKASVLNLISTSKFKNSTNNNYQSSLLLMRKLHRRMRQLKDVNTPKTPLSQVLICTWADFIKLPDETNVNCLIQQSQHLDEMMVLVLLWLIDVSKRPGREKRKNTAIGTVKTYLSNVGKPLLEQSIGRSILQLEPEELTEFYSDALDSRNIIDRAQRAQNMRNFHNFLMTSYLCSPVDWHSIEPTINNNDRAADANIISMREYNNTLNLLKSDPDSLPVEQDINQLILILCYRAGLRSGEATHLKLNDIDNKNWIIHVRTNNLHRTKTLKSNRRVPVDLLLSEEEKALINRRIELVKQYHPDAENPWLLCDKTTSRCLVYIDKHTSRINHALKVVSGDNTLRLHHARHSFANYLLLLTNELYYSRHVYVELQKWCRTDDIENFSHLVTTLLTGKQTSKSNVLHAISLAMGHASPETTLRSYIHVLGLLHATKNEKRLVRAIDKASMASITGVERSHVYKILARGCSERYGFLPLCEHVAKKWTGYQQLSSHQQKNNLQLSSITPNKDRIYIELNDIERIIRAAESGLVDTEIAYYFQLDFSFVQGGIKATQDIKLQTGYLGTSISSDLEYIFFTTNKKKQMTSAKYIKQEDFQKLLILIAKLSNQQMVEVTNIWLHSYTPNDGLVVSDISLTQFKNLLTILGYEVIDSKCDILVRDQYSKRKGTSLKLASIKSNSTSNNDNKVQHAIFLLSVYIKHKLNH